MSALTTILTVVLGGGGIAGLVALFKLRAEKDATVVQTVEKSVLILERLNATLEGDLAQERTARLAAEAEASKLRLELRYVSGDLTPPPGWQSPCR